MRLFNREVLRTTVFGLEQFTPAEMNSLLGSADALAIQYVATRGQGGGKVEVRIYHSNDNQNWVEYSMVNGPTLVGNMVETFIMSESLTGGTARGAFVRLGIKVSLNDADLVVTVTGRSV